jgi:hypothetical protein
MKAAASAMRLSPLAMLVISLSAASADFRLLDFGSSCSAVQEREERLEGSARLASKGAGLYYFSGKAFGRDVTISYLCPKGVLLAGEYRFPFESLDMALQSYRQASSGLASLYGAPSGHEPDLPAVVPGDPREMAANPPIYTSIWITPRAFVTLSLMSRRDWPNRVWQVFVIISRGAPNA